MCCADRIRVAVLLLVALVAPGAASAQALHLPRPSLRLECRLSSWRPGPGQRPRLRVWLEGGLGIRHYGLHWAVDIDASRGAFLMTPASPTSALRARVGVGMLTVRGVDRRTADAIVRLLGPH